MSAHRASPCVDAPATPLAPRAHPLPTPRAASGAPAAALRAGALDPVIEPRFDLASAIADPTFTARDPAELAVPPDLIDAIARADRILVIGHRQSDMDTAGSASAFRALEALGKSVSVCIDDTLPISIRHALGADAAHVQRAAALDDRSWDLAIVVDTHVAGQIGPAATALLGRAAEVAIVDHHLGEASPQDFSLPATARWIAPWIDPELPAAGLMTAAILARFDGATSEEDRARFGALPLYGFLRDTHYGQLPGVAADHYRYLKHMLLEDAHTTLEAVRATEYRAPERVRAGVRRLPLIREQVPPDRRLTTLVCPHAEFTRMLAPPSTDIDADELGFALKGRIDQATRDTDVALLLYELEPGRVQVSVRSRDPELAPALAAHLGALAHAAGGGGGGKLGVGAARMPGFSPDQVRAAVVAWLGAPP